MSGPAPGTQLIACSNTSASVPKGTQRTGLNRFHSTGVGAESQLNSTRRHSQASCQRADVAQMAEQLTCNQQVAGSIPAVGSPREQNGEKSGSAGIERGGAKTGGRRRIFLCGSSSVGRASAFQAERRGFDSRLPLSRSAQVAQSAEHVLGKDEVGGSIPLLGLLNSEAGEPVQTGCGAKVSAERYPSGQREQTVNLPAYAFGGSNPPLSIGRRRLQASGFGKRLRGVLPEARGPKPDARGAVLGLRGV